METFINNMMYIALQVVWAVYLFFTKPQDIENFRTGVKPLGSSNHKMLKLQLRHRKPKKCSSNLLFNSNNSSILNLSDLITPMEEEMLRCLCAKGFAGSYKPKKIENIKEDCISRDTFTNIWIDSCCSV